MAHAEKLVYGVQDITCIDLRTIRPVPDIPQDNLENGIIHSTENKRKITICRLDSIPYWVVKDRGYRYASGSEVGLVEKRYALPEGFFDYDEIQNTKPKDLMLYRDWHNELRMMDCNEIRDLFANPNTPYKLANIATRVIHEKEKHRKII